MNKKKYLIPIFLILAGCATTKPVPTKLFTIHQSVEGSGLGTGVIINSEGQTVRTLFKDHAVKNGDNVFNWDGLDDDGKPVEGDRFQWVLTVDRWDLTLIDDFGGVGASQGRFLRPERLCAANQGSRFTVAVADTGNNRIQLLTDSGAFLQEIGQFGLGDQKLNQPSDVDWDGLILTVCDSQNKRLARFDATGAYLGEVRQLSGFQTSPSHPVNLDFQNPVRLQREGGSFWVSDTGYSILDLVTVNGGLIQQLGTDVPLGNIGPFIKWPDGDIWIQTGKNEIRVIDSNGRDQGSLKVTPFFQVINDMELDPQGFAVVSDPTQDLIYLLDSKGICFECITPEKCSEPTGLSVFDDHLFVIDRSQNKVVHYKLNPEKINEYKKMLTSNGTTDISNTK